VTGELPGDGPLIDPGWVADNLDRFRADDPDYRLVEVNIQPERYADAHLPGAIGLDWQGDLQDTATFDVVGPSEFGGLLGSHGIGPETAVVLYGDFYNWFAAHAFWLLAYYRHANLRLLDGGRKYWFENGYPTTAGEPSFPAVEYPAPTPDGSIRADRADVEEAIEAGGYLLDVRAPLEYSGDVLAPPGWNEGVQRGGHIPGAENVPWSRAVRSDGRLKPATELATLYADVPADGETIVYCRIGERSALAWVVLHELLGFEDVSHYYGSWVEWGNTVGLPVEADASADLQ
jgi:thiosulfate/3-mercaptopyruvate sulfurtransferase